MNEKSTNRRQRLHPRAFALAASLSIALASPLALAQDLGSTTPSTTSSNLDANLLEFVDDALPERAAIDQAFLSPQYEPVLNFSQDAQVTVTFVDEGAGYRNSLGYMSFDQDVLSTYSKADVDTDGSGVVSVSEIAALPSVDVGWVFPNSSKAGAGGSLNAGDQVMLGDGELFEAGSSLSFFLGQNTYSSGGLTSTENNMNRKPVMYGLDFLNPEASADALFGETVGSSRHVAMLFANTDTTSVLMGFEDLNRDRGSDDDFNDAIFLVEANPPDALLESNILPAPVPHAGGTLASVALMAGFAGWFRGRTATDS